VSNWGETCRFPPTPPPRHLTDRTNLAFAAAGLKRDVGITIAQYGLGSSLLFVTYCGAQLLVSLIGARFGAVRMLSVACIVWGITAASMAAVSSPWSFYAARLALGLAEAPTYPLIATYLRTFHARDTAVGAAYSYVHAATLVASVIGGPIAAAVLSMDGLAGLAGWRWLFIVEGILPIAVGIWVAFLPHTPACAKFLTPEERCRLEADVTAARGDGATRAAAADAASLWDALKHTLTNWRIMVAGTIEGVFGGGKWAAQFFTPLIIEQILTGEKIAAGGPVVSHGRRLLAEKRSARYVILSALLSAIPFFMAAATSVLNGWAANKTRAARGWGRKWFIVWPGLVCAAGLFVVGPVLDAPSSNATRAIAFLAVIAALQSFAGWGVIMSLPSSLAGGTAAHGAMAYAMFIALGTLGGVWGPALMGALTAKAGSYTLGGAVLGGVALAMAALWAVTFGCIVPGGK